MTWIFREIGRRGVQRQQRWFSTEELHARVVVNCSEFFRSVTRSSMSCAQGEIACPFIVMPETV
jgi:hypothetical protein